MRLEEIRSGASGSGADCRLWAAWQEIALAVLGCFLPNVGEMFEKSSGSEIDMRQRV